MLKVKLTIQSRRNCRTRCKWYPSQPFPHWLELRQGLWQTKRGHHGWKRFSASVRHTQRLELMRRHNPRGCVGRCGAACCRPRECRVLSSCRLSLDIIYYINGHLSRAERWLPGVTPGCPASSCEGLTHRQLCGKLYTEHERKRPSKAPRQPQLASCGNQRLTPKKAREWLRARGAYVTLGVSVYDGNA